MLRMGVSSGPFSFAERIRVRAACPEGLRLAGAALLAVVVLTISPNVFSDDADSDEPPAPPAGFTVTNRWEPPRTFTPEEIEKMPHVELRAGDRVYRGVPLHEFLHATGVVWEGKCSPLLTCYLVAEAADGYRVLFSVPEIDPNQCHTLVLLADQRDGRPLAESDGPYEIVEEDAKQHGRWVRHATAVTLVRALPHAKAKMK